jgi:endonuclease YncB( thermonuclease family)
MIRAVSLALLCAASFGVVYWAMAPDEPEPAAPATVGSLNAPPATAAAMAAPDEADLMTFELRPGTEAPSAAGKLAAREVRNVTPDDMTAAPPVSGPLVRVAPPAEEPAPKRQEARTKRLFNAVVVAAGTLKIDDREIQLAGIAITKPGTLCGEGAKEWPCGRMARAALRSFIRGRAIDCAVPAATEDIPDPAHCAVGGEDIAEWLVAQGWAKRSGGDYEDAEKAAREKKLGLLSDGRPDSRLSAQPDELTARR